MPRPMHSTTHYKPNELPTEVKLHLRAAPDDAELLLEKYETLFPSEPLPMKPIVLNPPHNVKQTILGYSTIAESKSIRNQAAEILRKQI